ncbi:MAG: hypothetical protein WCI18_17250 [Pseudomonadota bacterium]
MVPTEPQYSTTTESARIVWLSGRDPLKKFDDLIILSIRSRIQRVTTS